MKHIIFFDSSCNLCKLSVADIIKKDKDGIFAFAPLDGKTADEYLSGDKAKWKKENTLVLLENRDRVWVRAKGVFRILYLLGRKWALPLCNLPGLDLFYRLVAKYRHHFSLNDVKLEPQDRFLP